MIILEQVKALQFGEGRASSTLTLLACGMALCSLL